MYQQLVTPIEDFFCSYLKGRGPFFFILITSKGSQYAHGGKNKYISNTSAIIQNWRGESPEAIIKSGGKHFKCHRIKRWNTEEWISSLSSLLRPIHLCFYWHEQPCSQAKAFGNFQNSDANTKNKSTWCYRVSTLTFCAFAIDLFQ